MKKALHNGEGPKTIWKKIVGGRKLAPAFAKMGDEITLDSKHKEQGKNLGHGDEMSNEKSFVECPRETKANRNKIALHHNIQDHGT